MASGKAEAGNDHVGGFTDGEPQFSWLTVAMSAEYGLFGAEHRQDGKFLQNRFCLAIVSVVDETLQHLGQVSIWKSCTLGHDRTSVGGRVGRLSN